MMILIKEIIEFKPGQTAKIFKIKARAKGGGGEDLEILI